MMFRQLFKFKGNGSLCLLLLSVSLISYILREFSPIIEKH